MRGIIRIGIHGRPSDVSRPDDGPETVLSNVLLLLLSDVLLLLLLLPDVLLLLLLMLLLLLLSGREEEGWKWNFHGPIRPGR